MVQVASGVLATLGGLGLVDVLVHAAGRYRQDEKNAWSTLSVMLVGVLSVIAAAIVRLLDVRLAVALAVPISAVALQVNRITATLLLAAGRYGAFDVVRGLPITAPLAAALVVAFVVGASAISIVWLYVAALVLGLLPAAMVGRWFPLRITRFAVPPAELRPLARQSAVWSLVQLGLARFDVLIVYFLGSPSEAGVYASAVALAEGAGFASVAMAYHSQRRGALGQVQRTRVDLIITALALLVGIVTLPVLVPLVLGDDFRDLPTLFTLYAPAAFGLSLLRPSLAFRFGRNAVSGSMPIVAGGLVVALLADLFLVPVHGSSAAALVSSCVYLGSYVALQHWWARKS